MSRKQHRGTTRTKSDKTEWAKSQKKMKFYRR
jgi:hypothetical protein